jgi:hypothetical protein
MNFLLRCNCIICDSDKDCSVIYKRKVTDVNLLNFLINYYTNLNINLLQKYEYIILYCKECDFYWQKFIPNEQLLFELYEVWIEPEVSKKKAFLSLLKYRKRVEGIFNSFIKSRINKKTPLKFLDYGAGWGGWSQIAQNMGVEVNAFEISPKRIDALRSLDIQIVSNLFQNIKYDLILLNQVLEHVRDVGTLLNQLNQSCDKNSNLIISVPNCKSVKNLILTEKFLIGKNQLHPIEHLNGFTNKSLSKLMIKYGFKKISIIDGIRIYISHKDLFMIKKIVIFIYNQIFTTNIIFRKI